MKPSAHIAPRNPHPKRRVRHKHASRAIANAHKVFQRELDSHDRRSFEAVMGLGDWMHPGHWGWRRRRSRRRSNFHAKSPSRTVNQRSHPL